MTLTIPPEIEATLVEQARRWRSTPEDVALDTLRARLPANADASPERLATHEEWAALIRSLARECGVSPPHEALSSEALYD